MPDAHKVVVVADEPIGTISPLLHGHFAEHLGRCVYDGLWVGRDSSIPNTGGFRTDVVQALKKIGIPQLRWPGGCFADSYHWRDGIGAADQRPLTFAESCGANVIENNQVGTHEFIALCREIGAEPYLAGNVGSGTPQELMDWVHYCNGSVETTLVRERTANGHPEPMNVRYWGVGNENWGCGGNYDAVDYAKEFKRFATFIKQMDSKVELIACGDLNRDWNLRIAETLRNHGYLLDHLSVHRYYGAGRAVDFNHDEYYQLMRGASLVEEDIKHAEEILRYFFKDRKVGIAFDEWGVWHPEAANGNCNFDAPNTLRDAVAAAGVLDVFHRWCEQVSMANLAQIVNVLQCLVETRGAQMWLTPTYHLFALYAPHRGGRALRVDLADAPNLDIPDAPHKKFPEVSFPAAALPLFSASASQKDGRIALSISNRHISETQAVEISLRGLRIGAASVAVLSGDAPNAVNSTERPERVSVANRDLTAQDNILHLEMPPCSVQTLIIQCA